MTSQYSSAYTTTAATRGAPTRPRVGHARRGAAAAPVVRDLRGRAGRCPRRLVFAAGDLAVVSGLPGSGKSTLIRQAARGRALDSQDTRDRWDARTPSFLPYTVYRPLVRLAHYARLWRALRSGEGVVVHDCGTQAWVRRWLAREARRRGTALHLVLLDVEPEVARQGQRERGRGVSRPAFARHRRGVGRLIAQVEAGDVPGGCASAVLLDRDAASALTLLGFGQG
ncbi:AAA family ATPase [Streptomyces clavuligerus]|uniref:Putative ATP/GTP-binding protein n=1 Tax=Streptomyces clavuligerus TaxID=1901 RepID=E2Q7U1_STRCL|nr:AAA family ATPase [Streptomyces clavuligerus]ANW17959.1 ATP-binding protein [Streptomyces clavuligerus]AXU12520.1 ATP-binding protein [Streptomyces clavuligerus]EFG09473.1 Putative ATP/GTP-binding protein [Streptomyces clavuligerus]MBY6302415.1 AAA family ATPase [Streptomyces clavuligerus]QCS05301.1 ATP-binding protein [Streptomyces clavuligerus]